jgi:alpha-N-arabinofuranosidase
MDNLMISAILRHGSIDDPGRSFNRRSLRIDLTKAGNGAAVGVSNAGYWGVPVKADEEYRLSLSARATPGITGLTASLEAADGTRHATAERLVVTAAAPGSVWLDMVSLFPAKTWKDRPNGLRPDLAEMLVALNPTFLRFPGGCGVEGDTMAEACRWQQTIGPLHERRPQWNICRT